MPSVLALVALDLTQILPGFTIWTRMPIVVVVVVGSMSISLVPRMIPTESTIVVVAMGSVSASSMVIVDDFSRFTWVYFFKSKDETKQAVIDFSNEVQRQHNVPILAIRSENGSEFKNYTLMSFSVKRGFVINILLHIPINKMV